MSSELAAGQMVGHYRIESWLGQGGMGVVYRAFDTHLDRRVAIKVLRADSVASPERHRRFVQEAKAASALNHPNIITIYDIDRAGEDDHPIEFIAMEYIEGDTLGHLIGRHCLRRQEVLSYAVQVADALAAAHHSGLIHRDLKPANVMVTGPGSRRPGLVKVLDFGLAKLVESDDGALRVNDPNRLTETVRPEEGPQTEKGTIIGTVAYMSPEQAEGEPVDARSDIFSFGALLYETLTGRWPFRGDTCLAILSAILKEEPPAPSSVVGDVPPELDKIVGRCLRKDPARRFQDMGDVRVALEELKDEWDGRGPAPAPAAPPARWWRRPGTALAAIALAAGLAGAGLGISRHGHPVPAEKHLAVLPFQNVGGNPENQAFCDGLAEVLASSLTQVEQFEKSLRVVPASEVRRGRIASARDARDTFGLSLVITGSVIRAGGEVRITTNLVDARSLLQLRSRTMRVRAEDSASLQERVIQEVVGLLELELGPQAKLAVRAGGTVAPGAYDYYLLGRGHLQRFDRLESIDNAITLLRQALDKDPHYTLAYAALGEGYWQKYKLTHEHVWIELARQSCAAAVQSNVQLAPVHVTLGIIYRGTGETELAVQELEKALQIDPVNADAYRELASAHETAGRPEQAEAIYRKAIQLRPDYWASYRDLGAFYYRRGRYTDAIEQFRTVTELTPDNAAGYASLGGIYFFLGRRDEAEAALKRSISITPNASAYTNLGTLYYHDRRYAESASMMEKAIERGASGYLYWGNLAEAYGRLPERSAHAPEVYRRALQLVQQHLAVNAKDAQATASLGFYFAKLGDKSQALAAIHRALALSPKNVNVLFRSALVYEETGERVRALDALATAIGGGYSIDEIQTAPDLAELRNDPRYRRMMQGRRQH